MQTTKVQQKGPKDVIDKVNSISEIQDRLGYVTEAISLIELIELMLSSWKQLYSSKNINNSSKKELCGGFLFMRDICLKMIDATNSAHNCMTPERIESIESGEFDPQFDDIKERDSVGIV